MGFAVNHDLGGLKRALPAPEDEVSAGHAAIPDIGCADSGMTELGEMEG
jgi:hypothetical protein